MEKPYLIDSHAHLIDEKYEDVGVVVREALEAGVAKIITPTTEVPDFEKALKVAREHEGVYVLIGFHPENVEKMNDGDLEVMERILSMRSPRPNKVRARDDKVVGIGEIGLDFYYDKEKRSLDKQVSVFRAQLDLALKYSLPVAIHMREADEEMKTVLDSYEKLPEGQFHCFSGDLSYLSYVLDKGFYVSFAGNVTFKNAPLLQEVMREVPLDRLLLETDSPYLSPEPLRGRLNSPTNVKIIAEFIAKERGESLEKIIEQTTKNALCLYSLEN